nr:hypothetical protein BHI3_15550 [Bacteriovorax sp. HI3]
MKVSSLALGLIFLVSNTAVSEQITLEDRVNRQNRKMVEKEEEMRRKYELQAKEQQAKYEKERKIQEKADKEEKLKKLEAKYSEDRKNIGKELTNVIRLVGLSKFSEEEAKFLNTRIETTNSLNELSILFDIWDRDKYGNWKNKIKTRVVFFDIGEKFKVKNLIYSESDYPYYLISASTGDDYLIPLSSFNNFFVNKSIIRNQDLRVVQFAEAYKDNQKEIKAMFCAKIKNYAQVDTINRDPNFVENAEENDPKLLDWMKSVDIRVKEAAESLTPAYQFKLDKGIYNSELYNGKNICYGATIKNRQSFMALTYYMPRLVYGSWRF